VRTAHASPWRRSTSACAVHTLRPLIHVLSYAAGIVLVRTLAFVGGWIATLWVGWVVVAH